MYGIGSLAMQHVYTGKNAYMAYTEQDIARLILKYFRDEISPSETAHLERWLAESPQNRLFFEGLDDENDILQLMAMEEQDEEQGMKTKLLQEIQKRIGMEEKPVPAIGGRLRRWYGAAAAVILIATSAWFFWGQGNLEESVVDLPLVKEEVQDVLPGTDRAILTLSNGQQVELDNSGRQVITDGELAIANNGGELVYAASDKTVYNTMTTPKGGQYKITLADGSRVWLNAASSITFPTRFAGNAREVQVTGEVYFEVERNKKMPFVVKLPGDARVEVLGTHFNVNTYNDETYQTTTLVEGLVRVTNAGAQVELTEGQQASITAKHTTDRAIKVTEVNVEEVTGWKNNLFVFNEADIPTVMRQISRWYDLDISYNGPVPSTLYKGKIPRDFTLSQVLNALKLAGVHFKVEGKTLIVSGRNKK